MIKEQKMEVKHKMMNKLVIDERRIRYTDNYNGATWLYNPEEYLYVRETFEDCSIQTRKPYIKDGRTGDLSTVKHAKSKLIGWYKEKTSRYSCRFHIFWLKPYDVGMPFGEKSLVVPFGYGSIENINEIGMPCEAVTFSKNKNYIYVCEKCGKSYRFLWELNIHQQNCGNK